MTRREQLEYLVRYFAGESLDSRDDSADLVEADRILMLDIKTVPDDELFRLFRSLVNVRPPRLLEGEPLAVQNAFLKGEIAAKGIEDAEFLFARAGGSEDAINGMSDTAVWQGDITTLKADAIVNAANSELLGCWVPCHACIDNCIHTYAGVQLRYDCAAIMHVQKFTEPAGQAKITPAYNLPAKYVLHTVGPIITGKVSARDRQLLSSCYTSCLNAAAENGCRSVAFCCISTGVFHFPNEEAAEIAVQTVRSWQKEQRAAGNEPVRVVFCVYKDIDKTIYEKILR
jgi:O-acetyl-ADP-ribose deacetylase (regulator of RNase III)